MDKFPLLRDGRPAGELIAEREALYTWFEARCPLPGEGLWCAWAVGDLGELRLGILEPVGDLASIRRRFSARLTDPLGRLQWGEIRPACPAETGAWTPLTAPEALFRAPGLRRELGRTPGVLIRDRGDRRDVAVPYDPARPFPLTALFCFARICQIGGQDYAVFAFDREERPVF